MKFWRLFPILLILGGVGCQTEALTDNTSTPEKLSAPDEPETPGDPTLTPSPTLPPYVEADDLGNSALPEPASPTPAADSSAAEPSFAGTIPAPEFPPQIEWLNAGRPLSMAELRGKIVLLDFWTYGCINCIHVIPDLKALEEKYAQELVVIGVHSAKFDTEKETDNIRQIILRYELEHPVINDRDFVVWQMYGANAWPTFVLIDPNGNVLGFHAGEGIYDLFDTVIAGMVAEFDVQGLIDRTPLELILEKESQLESPLLFPGKVLADGETNRLFIADSNHNRIVITDFDGLILDVIGSGRAAFQDGGFENAAFFRPQGLTLVDEKTLYVADTENHAIRRIDLESRIVETVAGNGRQGAFIGSEGVGTEFSLNSPWDVLYNEGILYIAMAGQHQLWQYNPETDQITVFAGSGREELKDGPLLTGGLNQPSGLASDGQQLFIADSEASAIRSAGLNDEMASLTTIVGTGLFDFGDSDGIGVEVRLQHPLGVVYQDGLLYVADTYNHKIKAVDPHTRESVTLFGSGGDGWRDGKMPLFDEPGGLSINGSTLYIADTNNHVIRVADLDKGTVETLVLIDVNGLLTRQAEGELYTGRVVTQDERTVSSGNAEFDLIVDLPDGFKLNDSAPFSLEWHLDDKTTAAPLRQSFSEVAPSFPIKQPINLTSENQLLQLDLTIYYCESTAESLCYIERARIQIPLNVQAENGQNLEITYAIPQP